MSKKKKSDEKSVTDKSGVAAVYAKFARWSVNEQFSDYGLDFEIRIIADDYRVTENSFYVQLKSTTKLSEENKYNFHTKDLILYEKIKLPVILLRYCTKNEKMYWVCAQDYIWNNLDKVDENWRNQKYKIINFENEVVLESINENVLRIQKLIVRNELLKIPKGDNLHFTKENIFNLQKHMKKYWEDYEHLFFEKIYLLQCKGQYEQAKKELDIFINPNNKSESTLKAIILKLDMTVDVLGHFNFSTAKETISLGKNIAKSVNSTEYDYFIQLFDIFIDYQILHQLLKQKSLALRVERQYNEPLMEIFTLQNINNFLTEIENLNQRMESIRKFLRENNLYIYFWSTVFVIRILINKLLSLATLDRSIIPKIVKSGIYFEKELEFALESNIDKNFQFQILNDLALYYVNTVQSEKAIELYSKSRDLAEELGFDGIELINEKIQRLRDHPNVYEIPKNIKKSNFDELNGIELKKYTLFMLDNLGIPWNDKNELKKYLEQNFGEMYSDYMLDLVIYGIDDLDPTKYYKFCSNIFILPFVSGGLLSKVVYLNTVGDKILWCKFMREKSISPNPSLNLLFQKFKKNNCNNCETYNPRNSDWEWSLKWQKIHDENVNFKNFHSMLFESINNKNQ